MLNTKLKILAAVIILTQAGLSQAYELDISEGSWSEAGQRHRYTSDIERRNMLAGIHNRLAETQKQLNNVELQLDYISQSEKFSLLNKLLENRFSASATTTYTAGGMLIVAFLRKEVSRRLIGGGIIMFGTGMYLALSDRANAYEKTMLKLNAMSDDEIILYTKNKLDEYETLMEQQDLLKQRGECVAKAQQPMLCR